MKLELKKINLKEEIEKDIEEGICDTDKFVEQIKTYLEKANFLLENKILDLDEKELYDALKQVYEIKYDNEDYLKILSNMNKKHYLDIINLNTNIIDEEGYNIEYIGITTTKTNYNGRVGLKELDNMINSQEFVILKERKHKLNDDLKSKEKYKTFKKVNLDQILDEDKESFEYVLELIRKKIKDKKVLKQILDDLKKYVDNLMYQAKSIAKLSEDENPRIRQIGKQYKKALEENFNKKNITQKNNHKRRY